MRLTNYLNCVSKLPKNYANFPESYIKSKLKFIEYKTPKGRNFLRKEINYKPNPYYDKHKIWTREFQDQNSAGFNYPRIYKEPLKHFPIFKGDQVEILTGRDKGKVGIVSYTIEERNWIYVEGMNLRRNLINKSHKNPGFLQTEEAPLLLNRDVTLIDPGKYIIYIMYI